MAGIDKAAILWSIAIVAVGVGFAIVAQSIEQSVDTSKQPMPSESTILQQAIPSKLLKPKIESQKEPSVSTPKSAMIAKLSPKVAEQPKTPKIMPKQPSSSETPEFSSIQPPRPSTGLSASPLLEPQARLPDISGSISLEFDKERYRISDKAEITMTFQGNQASIFYEWDKDRVDEINLDLGIVGIDVVRRHVVLTESGIDTGIFKGSLCMDTFGISTIKVSHPTYHDSVYATADIKPLRSSDSDDYIKFKKESNIRAIETVGWDITSKDERLDLMVGSGRAEHERDFYDLKIKSCGISKTFDKGKTPPMWSFIGFDGGYVTVTLDYDYEITARPPVRQAFQADNELRIDYYVDPLEIPNSNFDTSGDRTLKIFEDTDLANIAAGFSAVGDIRDFDSASPSDKFVVRLYDPSRDHGFWHEVLEIGTQVVTDYVLSSLGDAFGIPISEIVVLGIDCPSNLSAGACLREYADEQDVLTVVTSEKTQIPHPVLLERSDYSDKVYKSKPIRVSDITSISGDKIIIFYKSMNSALKVN